MKLKSLFKQFFITNILKRIVDRSIIRTGYISGLCQILLSAKKGVRTVFNINNNPISGNGIHKKTRFADHKSLQKSWLGHGFSNFWASKGTWGAGVYF
jgi:hypothetical protein